MVPYVDDFIVEVSLDGEFAKWTGKKMDVSFPRTDLFLARFGDRETHTSVHAQFVARHFPRPPAGVDLDDWRVRGLLLDVARANPKLVGADPFDVAPGQNRLLAVQITLTAPGKHSPKSLLQHATGEDFSQPALLDE